MRKKRASSRKDAGQRFVDMLRKQVLDGVWKTGNALPKFAWFQAEYHAGHDTISHALGILAAEGLLHKQGKRWIVGPSAPVAGRSLTSLKGTMSCPVAEGRSVFSSDAQRIPGDC